MSYPAFREGDCSVCPAHGSGVAHPAPGTVRVNGLPLRKVGDALLCAEGSVDKLSSGASTVRVASDYAGRIGEATRHSGTVTTGSPNVRIGGPSGCGCVGKLIATCVAMADGRNPPKGAVYPNGQQIPSKTEGQSYNNCGMEVMRMIIRQATGSHVDQEKLLDHMVDNHTSPEARRARGVPAEDLGRESKAPKDRFRTGNTRSDEQAMGLGDWGVDAEVFQQSPGAIQQAVKDGKGVLVGVSMGTLLGPASGIRAGAGGHAMLVTGIEYDADGHVVAYVVNDPASGCGISHPAWKFERALLETGVVTKKPIW